MGSEGVVVLAIIDAVVVVMFFLFRVIPWSKPGPWRLIWITATLAFMLFSLGEVSAIIQSGTALSLEVQGPLFGAILATTSCFILMYLHQARIAEHALRLARTDDLTRLPNTRAFNERLESGVRGPDPFSVAYIHLDGLGAVNDLFGAHPGDALLKGFADVLRHSSGAGDFAARIGGDKFALIVAGSEQRAGEVIQKIQGSFHELVLREVAVEVAAVVGVVSRSEASDPGRLVRLAYRAMLDAQRVSLGSVEPTGT